MTFGGYRTQTDYDIEMAGREARKRAREDFEAGKSYENPYSPTDVIHFDYAYEWKNLSKSHTSNKGEG